MSVIWKDEEIELLKVLRPVCTTKEIEKIFALLDYNRSAEAILRKSRQFEIKFKQEGSPELSSLSKATSEVISEVINQRTLKGSLTNSHTDYHPNGHDIKGVSTLIDSNGNTVMQWYKTQKENLNKSQILKKLIAELPDLITKPSKPVTKLLNNYKDDVLSVYPIGDPHIGMLAWGPETFAKKDFNSKEAQQQLQAAMGYLVNQAEPTTNALIINLGDFFHTDNSSNLTNSSKNPLDVDVRWNKLLRIGLATMVNMIDLALTRHKKVRTIVEIGNHDDHSSMFLAVALNAYYRNEPRVSIDMSPAKFHYLRFGQNLIGVTHGDTVKPKDLESIMACDKAEDWGDTKYRYWYIGHVHHSSKWEFRGCTVESFRTLAPKDAWHHSQGYRSRNDMSKIMLHKEYGEIFRATVDSRFLRSLRKE